jgi:rhodanese-related sulfurtransferase
LFAADFDACRGFGQTKARGIEEDDMVAGPNGITATELRARLHDGGEIAIVDAREEGSFHERHLLMASCLPLSRLELLAAALLPRRSALIVVCDAGVAGGGDLAERAAARLIAGGWSDVAVLNGGVEAWGQAD